MNGGGTQSKEADEGTNQPNIKADIFKFNSLVQYRILLQLKNKNIIFDGKNLLLIIMIAYSLMAVSLSYLSDSDSLVSTAIY